MRKGLVFRLAAAAVLLLGAASGAARDDGTVDSQCVFPFKQLPSEIGDAEFEEALARLIAAQCYETLGWEHDENIRSTGPYIYQSQGGAMVQQSYATHGSGGVRIYYSPEVYRWMELGRQGELPDGATIVKVMYSRDEADRLNFTLEDPSYAIMVKDSKGSWGGWFWSDGTPWVPATESNVEDADGRWSPVGSPGQSFCTNCHASAVSELTYSALRNIEGDELTYVTQVQTTADRVASAADETEGIHARHPSAPLPESAAAVPPAPWPPYWKIAGRTPPPAPQKPAPIPFRNSNFVTQGPSPDGQKQFITSDQCQGCHDATQSNSGVPNMQFVDIDANGKTTNQNLAPYGEWSFSLMGLSGRDPIFFAQLETERVIHPELSAEIDNKCLSCHGVMGQRQYLHDKGPAALFTQALAFATPETDPANAKYGALARDGVSCAVCHRILPDGLGTFETYTGAFKVSEEPTEIYGPYEQVATTPMEHGLGLTPKYGEQIADAALCGSCHTVFTPSLDVNEEYTRAEFDKMAEQPRNANDEFHEQTTYFEWKNSVYADSESADAASCQHCHMPQDFADDSLAFRIANIEDDTFAAVDHRVPDADLLMRIRGGEGSAEQFFRHAFSGLNALGQTMFQQFPWLLGVQLNDYANFGLQSSARTAIESTITKAQDAVDVSIADLRRTSDGLAVEVLAVSHAGHKFPSGVGFRRAFLELDVEVNGVSVWTSGATDSWGVIGTTRNGAFTPLATEFLEGNRYQPHYDARNPITEETQVQIYEELVKDSNGNFTTSFLSLRDEVKDNRIQPKGWSPEGPESDQTKPVGGAADDPSYLDGSGSDTVPYEISIALAASDEVSVTATLYYQTIPPYYLSQRFQNLGMPNTDRLYYLVRNLQLSGPLADWKLLIESATKDL